MSPLATLRPEDWRHLEHDIPCPVCSSKSRTNIKEFPGQGTWFVQCNDCGMKYYNPRLEEKYLVKNLLVESLLAIEESKNMFYKGVFFGEPLNNSPEEQKSAIRTYYDGMIREQSNLFRSLNGREPESMFEVGSSVGWYLVAARDGEAKLKGRLAGCDANPHSARIGSEGFGIPIFGGVFQDRPDDGFKYDLLTALDYIEHTYTPVPDLHKLRALANPNAVLILKTFVEEHDTAGAYVQPLHHVNHFYGHNLKDAVTRAGWKIHRYDDTAERVYSLATVFASAV